jgi:hypothetical protein
MKRHYVGLIAAIAFLRMPAYAAEPPSLREGLWTVHIVVTDGSTKKTTERNYIECRNHASDKAAEEAAAHTPMYSIISDTFQDGTRRLIISVHAKDRTVEAKSVMTYTGDTAFRTVAHTILTFTTGASISYDGVTEAKFIGACPDRLKPGQREESH